MSLRRGIFVNLSGESRRTLREEKPMSNDGYAIVLHHGFCGFDAIQLGKLKLAYFGEIERALIERGHPVIVTRVHPTGGIERRARELKSSILKQLRARRIRGK